MTQETKKQPKDKEVDQAKTTHEGYLEKVTFTGKGDWVVVKLEGMICTGVMSQREMGARYKLTGKTVYSSKYNGWQFQFDKYEKLADSSRRGVINYLTKQIVGIGPKQAEEIWNAFGSESLNVIADNPEKIAGRIGVLPDQAKSYSEQVKAVRKQAQLSTKLYALGLTEWFVGKMIAAYGDKAEEQLKYRCFEITKVHGIGFLKASDVADKIGMPKDHPTRVKAAISYAVTTKQQLEGHCCLEVDELIREVQELLKIDVDKINKNLKEMIAEFQLVTDQTDLTKLKEHMEKKKRQKQKEEAEKKLQEDQPTIDELDEMGSLTEEDFAQLG